MKLLFDQNLSRTLVARLKDVFPEATHVALVGLEFASDTRVWIYARDNGFVVVSKDSDFRALALRPGSPKVVLVALGNVTTTVVERAIRRAAAELRGFESSESPLFVITPEDTRG